MSLTQRQKKFVREQVSRKSEQQIADALKVDIEEVQAYIEKAGLRIDPARNRLFAAIAVLLPFLFLGLLEVGLRMADYKGDLALFREIEAFDREYLTPNSNFTARYFFYTRTLPSPQTDLFLKEKPENGFRVFVMGGSTTAAYPYGYNAAFARVFREAMEDAMPGKHVEVVNVATSAINTYTLYDQVGELLAQDPDLILIYSGHNEYYGALGIGSNESAGSAPGFVRAYLAMQRLKVFLLARDVATNVVKWMNERGGSAQDEGATLMARIVREQSIPLNGEIYEKGLRQFQSNLKAIVLRFSDRGIPVMIGSLASNEKDQPPFVSAQHENLPAAQSVYDEAVMELELGNSARALELFQFARDLDLLKFRAPSAFNGVIREITEEMGAVYVPVEETLREASSDGIIGEGLMLEHLHPNDEGYFLMGKSFVEAMQRADFLGFDADSARLKPMEVYRRNMFLSEFDRQIGVHRIRTLKEGWPFTDRQVQSYRMTYEPVSRADSLAFVMVHEDLAWDRAKVDLASYYQSVGRKNDALLEYYGLIRNQPWNDSPYLFAARVFLDENDFDAAFPLLLKAYEIEPEEAFTTKMLGAIYVDRGELDEGIRLLEESLALKPNDTQAIFNLSGAYGLKRDFPKALELADRVLELDPRFPGARAWRQQVLSFLE